MMLRAIGSGALLLLAAACGGDQGANLTNNAAAGAGRISDAQNQVRNLPEGQRNGVLIRAIRDRGHNCQHVQESLLSEAAKSAPVYMATCDDGAVYAVAIRDDGTATVHPALPSEGQ